MYLAIQECHQQTKVVYLYLYNMQDSIQNRQSDFEMESDDTDVSDEEADEDAIEVDKEY